MEGTSCGVKVVTSDAPSEYHVAPRTATAAIPVATAASPVAIDANPIRAAIPVSVSAAPVGVIPASVDVIPVAAGVSTMGPPPPPQGSGKKRGRPRKNATDESVTVALPATPISSAPPASVIDFSAAKRIRVKHAAGPSFKPHQPKSQAENLGGGNVQADLLTVYTGEDITKKVISYAQQCPRTVCVLSAIGAISRATVRQPESSGGTVTHEGLFNIVSLTGTFSPSESGGLNNRAGSMTISMVSQDGRIMAGCVAGSVVAGGPVLLVVGSFLPGNVINPGPTSAVPFSSVGVQENYGTQGHHASGAAYPSFHGDAGDSSGDHNEPHHEG